MVAAATHVGEDRAIRGAPSGKGVQLQSSSGSSTVQTCLLKVLMCMCIVGDEVRGPDSWVFGRPASTNRPLGPVNLVGN